MSNNLDLITPESFLKTIPTDIEQNIQFRKALHSWLAGDTGAQRVYINFCMDTPEIAFDSMFWTFDPRKKTGGRNLPFILRNKQRDIVRLVSSGINNGHDVAIDKSRDEGATELICKMFALYWLFDPECMFLVGSRKEALVDSGTKIEGRKVFGHPGCLFHKILYTIIHSPLWIQPKIEKVSLRIQNMKNASVIDGETTNIGFGTGDRRKAVLVDEVALIEPRIAESIIENIPDVSDCCIYNSTPGPWGDSHPYTRLIEKTEYLGVLDYADNPVKNGGLYSSPDLDIIEIYDIDYYRRLCPGVFNSIEPGKPFKLSDFEKDSITSVLSDVEREALNNITFIADGGSGTYGRQRSVWYDSEERRRRYNTRYMAQNVLRIPYGAADKFFNVDTIHKIENKFIKQPDRTGDLIKGRFKDNRGSGRLRWWGKWFEGRPDQHHNYIIGCDISRGTGSSNSVAAILDVNTCEIVGYYVNPFIGITEFAEFVVKELCKWVGGASGVPFLIWEANGPGEVFGQRIRKLGYNRVYIRRQTRTKQEKRTNKYGWYSTAGRNGTKMDMLQKLDEAMTEGIKVIPQFTAVIIYDADALREMKGYRFAESREDVQYAGESEDSSGATYAHGDRVIATGLCVIALRDQPKAVITSVKEVKKDSFMYRFKKWKEEQLDKKKNFRRFRY